MSRRLEALGRTYCWQLYTIIFSRSQVYSKLLPKKHNVEIRGERHIIELEIVKQMTSV
jgi:hypothetical protein